MNVEEIKFRATDLESPVDFAFLAAQTFGDRALERDVLRLFVAQAKCVVPSLINLAPRGRADAAHLLKGSARGIGAWRSAVLADAYEAADDAGRKRLLPSLVAAFEQAAVAIAAHLTDEG